MSLRKKEIRGILLNGLLRFVKRKWGIQGLEECKKKNEIGGEIQDGLFYPISVSFDILEWIYTKKGENKVIEAGRYLVNDMGYISWLIDPEGGEETLVQFEDVQNEMFNFNPISIIHNENKVRFELESFYDTELFYLFTQGIIEGLLERIELEGEMAKRMCDTSKESAQYLFEINFPDHQ